MRIMRRLQFRSSFKLNKMIVNPKKLLAILLNKKKSDHVNLQLYVGGTAIKSASFYIIINS